MKYIIVKNNTAQDIEYSNLSGIIVTASGQRVFHEVLNPYEISLDEDFLNDVLSGTVTINDGTSDLSPQNGEAYLNYAYVNHTHDTLASGIHYHDDRYYTQDEVDTLISGVGGGSKDVQIVLNGDDGESAYEIDTSSYEVVRRFYFAGTYVLGIPTEVKIIGYTEKSSGTGYVQLYDYTNNNLISQISYAGTSPEIYTDDTLYDLPSGEAIFEIRTKYNDDKAYLHSLIIKF